VLCSEGEGGFRMKNPALTAVIEGKHRTLYMSTVPSIERQTRDNLKKTLTGRLNFISGAFVKRTKQKTFFMYMLASPSKFV
jgi:hypothetical protein